MFQRPEKRKYVKMMDSSVLKDKVILAVDDEPDVLETIEEILNMCILYKARDFDTATQYLLNYTYDIVILDIMGVNGFELLRTSVAMGFPTVMLTAHALTPEALKKAIKLGAVSFLPKEKMRELPEFLEEVVLGRKESVWSKLFSGMGAYFNSKFGPDWREKDQFFKEFEAALKKSEKAGGSEH
ncbi:Response regulator receiver domain protein [uncultured Desulfatiglans sp.]|uniref:Response regulator receiver domain protein n=1 Tax=Uncultured Desulfatiglans sp. TaxID=1748965 RepID=A0A653ADY2_UNCDX|nr:Response regulator receiver domain protein [uncultured Desulfatiglans sp.]